MKIVILTSYKTAHFYKVNYLTDRKNVVAKVVEKRPVPSTYKEKMEIRQKMVKKYGYVRTINKLIYNKYKYYLNDKKFNNSVKQILFSGSSDIGYTTDIPTIEVNSINEKKSVDFISGYNPDIIAVCGTSVIKPEVFKLARYGTINIHCGITPEYRSADTICWALYNKEPDKVGVTIHFVDEGIDTGSIIYQKAVGVTKNDNLATLYCKCQKTGIALMVKAIDNIERGNVKTIRKDNVISKAFYHIDLGIWQYMVFQRRFKKLKRSL